MSDEKEWQGDAGAEVWKRIYMVDRANAALEQAQRELLAAQDEHRAAERDLDTAKGVYFAGQRDLEQRIRAPKVTAQKREWLKVLAGHEVFGNGEMVDAAEQIGWSAKPGAVRTLASEYRKAGYFTAVDHGAMRLNRRRIVDMLGDIFVVEGEPSPEPTNPLDNDGGDLPAVSDISDRMPSDFDDGFEEDDTPF